MQPATKRLAKHRLSVACAYWKAAERVFKANDSQAHSMGLLNTQRHALETCLDWMQNFASIAAVALVTMAVKWPVGVTS